MTGLVRTFLFAGIAALLTVVAVVGAMPNSSAAAKPAWYDGKCLPKDSNGVTVVVDFKQLDGNGGRAAPMIVRCSPVKNNDATIKRTGLQALVDAGIVVSGTQRWGDNYPASVPFVCRVNGRPAADEPLKITSTGTTYYESCADTPASTAYWSYWSADGSGSAWTFNQVGPMGREVVPGGFEGWSFSLNHSADATDDVAPTYPPVSSTQALQFTAKSTKVRVGSPVSVSWNAAGSDHVVATGDWNGKRLASGAEKVTFDSAGTHVLTLTTSGLNPELSKSLTFTVTADDSGTNPPVDAAPSPTTSAAARQSASWLAGELQPIGQMPGPTGGTDWGLTTDTLMALYASGTGARTAQQLTAQLDAHAGLFIGPDVFKDSKARIGGSVAKLLVAAVVAGKDPEAFGHSSYLPKTKTYNLRAETLALIRSSSPQRGMLTNRDTGSASTNVFSQSLAVIGLARSGGVPAAAVEFLRSQQCRAGYFRMVYDDKLSCDAGKGKPDTDGTSMALQALMTARANGVTGLDSSIERGLTWLQKQQRSDGGYSGGVGTEAANANSAGLAAQSLYQGAQFAANTDHLQRGESLIASYRKARSWVLRVHADSSTAGGTKLAKGREYGAIGYDSGTFAQAKSAGIGDAARDQWRRATSQAIFALAPVSFADLGTTDLVGDPVVQNHPSDTSNGNPGNAGGGTGVRNGTDTASAKVVTAAKTPAAKAVPVTATPAGRLAGYLVGKLTDGDHIEVTLKQQTYVDYNQTADLSLALGELGTQDAALNRVRAFLLHPKSIAAFAHGQPYEKGPASYAEPLAKLAIIARLANRDAPSKSLSATIAALDTSLAALDHGGTYADTGRYRSGSDGTARQAWITLARAAAGDDTSDEVKKLVGARCPDGGFASTLGGDCPTDGSPTNDSPTNDSPTNDSTVAGIVVEALNASTSSAGSTEPGADRPQDTAAAAADELPASWTDDRATTIETAATAALHASDRSGLARGDNTDLLAAADLAVTRQAAGLDITNTANALAAAQHADGGFGPVAEGSHEQKEPEQKKAPSTLAASLRIAPAVAAASWPTLRMSPVSPTVRLPLATNDVQRPTAQAVQDGPSAWRIAGIAGLAALAGGSAVAGAHRVRSRGAAS